MPELVGDIKKIDQDKIKEDREILLRYLAEVDQKNETKSKPSGKKLLDGLTSKPDEAKPVSAVPVTVRPIEAKIDFVKDFQKAESKLNRPISEIFHESAVRLAVETPPAAITPVSAETPANRRTELKIVKAPSEIKPLPERPNVENTPVKNKFFAPSLKKISKKKQAKIERQKRGTLKKGGEEAINYFGMLVYKFLSAVTAVAIVYFLFCLSLYTFGFDNWLSRSITGIFPVPAFITQYGIVNYYEYIDAKNASIKVQKDADRALVEVLASITAREQLIKRQILSGVAKNYGLRTNSLNTAETEELLENKLALMIVADPAVNIANLRKLRSVKSALLGGADFKLVADSFGLQTKTEYFNQNSIKEKFGQKALEFAASSTIESTSVKQGYYVFQFYNQQDNLTGFKYIFVPATTLETIMADRFKAANLIILAN